MRHLRPAGRLAFFPLSHCQFPKRQVSLTWSSSRENRLHSCLAHTRMCTHTQVRKEREKMRHLMKDGKQVFFSFTLVHSGFLLDGFGTEVLLSCLLYAQVDQTKAY